jgi:hypothetical protein
MKKGGMEGKKKEMEGGDRNEMRRAKWNGRNVHIPA